MAVDLKKELPPRQYEVVCNLMQGLTNGEIANCMGTTSANISMLLSAVCKRLGIKSQYGISLKEQLINFVNNNKTVENKPKNEEVPADAICCPGGGAMSEEMNNKALEAVTLEEPESVKSTEQPVDVAAIIEIIKKKRDEVYKKIGEQCVLDGRDTYEFQELRRKGGYYNTALNVIEEAMSCKGEE